MPPPFPVMEGDLLTREMVSQVRRWVSEEKRALREGRFLSAQDRRGSRTGVPDLARRFHEIGAMRTEDFARVEREVLRAPEWEAQA